MGWRVLAFRQNCLEICRAAHNVSGRNVAQKLVYGDMLYWVIHCSSLKRERQTGSRTVYSQLTHMLFTNV